MQSKPLNETEVVVEPTIESPNGEVVTPPAAPEIVSPVPPAPVVPEVDYRAKFGNSTRENQVLQGELESLTKQLGEITKEEIPTDEEMKQKYPEYEFADSLMQSVLKRQEVQDRRQKGIALNVGKFLGSVTRRNELAAIVATNAALAGKETKFIDFASDPSRANTPVATLVSAFLFEVKDETPAPVPTPPTPPVPPAIRQQPVLERGTPSGGETPSTPSAERSPEELQALRTSNPREYNELIRKGQI